MIAKFVGDDESGIGHKLFVAPAFDIAEAGKPVTTQCYHSFVFKHFLLYILGRALGYTRAAHFGRAVDGVEDFIHVFHMFLG